MLSSERPPRLFTSTSMAAAPSSPSSLGHHQHQRQDLMRRGSSKSTTKEYCYASNGSGGGNMNGSVSAASTVPSVSYQGYGYSQELKVFYSSSSHQGSGPNYCPRDRNSIGYRHPSLKDSGDSLLHRPPLKRSEGHGWHSASCKLPSTRQHTYSESIPIEVPTICVTSDNRRTSISSSLRFTRTFSTDSIDSLERQCMKEVRRQRILMDEIELKETPALPPSSLLSPSNNGYPSLRDVGRSKTDPGGAESESATPTVPAKVISGYSFDSTKLSAQLSDIAFKRSSPDLSIDGVKPRTLRDVIGVTVYQAKLLSQCWPNIYATGTSGSFASQLYSNLAKRNSKAKTILTKADGVAVFSQSDTDCTSMHVKLTLELIDTIIRTLDTNPTSMITYLTEIGQSHRGLKDEGMSTAMWDDFGDAILEGVRKNDLVRRHKELRRAWLAIIAFITDNIKQGHCTFKASPSTNDINDRNNKEQS